MVTDDAGEISIADERSVPSREGSSSGAKMTTTCNSYEEARKRRVAELQARLQEIGSLQAAEELRSLASKYCQHNKLIEVDLPNKKHKASCSTYKPEGSKSYCNVGQQ
ncbi:unnamed protein product [Sphagnum troendelagicum]|uniref:Uncharacterized protein n=1 Tax=Sphagnum troendelagicum TaxID=128251 RepID=A0ABP0TXA0_9BRYO